MKGDLSILERPIIALAGAQNASSLGMRMTRSLARDLGAEGFAIAASLDGGIDEISHKTALHTGTVAVMSGGIDIIPVDTDTALYTEIGATGLLISEQPMGLQPLTRHMAQRSRLIAGLSLATVVVEAAHNTPAIATATVALEQGRDVMAVPAHPFEGRASGGNALIRDGASLIRGARDIIEVLGSAPHLGAPQEVKLSAAPQSTAEPQPPTPEPQSQQKSSSGMAPLHSQILSRLGPSPISEDQLIRDLAARADQVSAALLLLELDGAVKRRSGGLLALA
jgi:DNA processing protein